MPDLAAAARTRRGLRAVAAADAAWKAECPTAKHCANCRAGWPAACRRRAPRRACSPGWRWSAPARACCSRCTRRARSSPSAACCRCRTRSPGSSAWPTCAAACMRWSTWRLFLGLQRGPAALAGDGSRDSARLLALNPSLGVNCALLVDRLAGLRNADQLSAEPADARRRPSGRPLPARAGAMPTAGCGRKSTCRRWPATNSSWASRAEAGGAPSGTINRRG